MGISSIAVTPRSRFSSGSRCRDAREAAVAGRHGPRRAPTSLPGPAFPVACRAKRRCAWRRSRRSSHARRHRPGRAAAGSGTRQVAEHEAVKRARPAFGHGDLEPRHRLTGCIGSKRPRPFDLQGLGFGLAPEPRCGSVCGCRPRQGQRRSRDRRPQRRLTRPAALRRPARPRAAPPSGRCTSTRSRRRSMLALRRGRDRRCPPAGGG